MPNGNNVWMQLDHEERRLAMDLRMAQANATPLKSCPHDDNMAFCPLCLIAAAQVVLNQTPKMVQHMIFAALERGYELDFRR